MKLSLVQRLIDSEFYQNGILSSSDGSLFKCFATTPLSGGVFEENFDGSLSEQYFNKLSELLTRLPNLLEGQILLVREKLPSEISGFQTKLYFFEKIQKMESYSHLKALLDELKLSPVEMNRDDWKKLLKSYFGKNTLNDTIPDTIWEKDHLRVNNSIIKTLSLTELPQLTWKGCFQDLFEYQEEFILSLKFHIPDRQKIKKQLETKRRVSHALSISTSLEVKNIESNSVLHSSEETLERILIGKETLFEISMAVILNDTPDKANQVSYDFERVTSGIGNAGLFRESVGTLPIFKSHIPGNKTLKMRSLPILSTNLSEMLPLILDYSTANDSSSLELRSRNLEKSNLNLFSQDNLNFNAFLCGASGAGKSFLMNAILTAQLKDEPSSRLCIFDVGGSYKKLIAEHGGESVTLTLEESKGLIATYLKHHKITKIGFFRVFIETLCGSGSHITHSHRVAIDDLLNEFENEYLSFKDIMVRATSKNEKCYHDIALWLKPHAGLDEVADRNDLNDLIQSKISAFDFKQLDTNPILQRVTILLLTELLWKDLILGTYPKTVIVFDEVWKFFIHCKSFLEEMYRTLRKYKAGIVSITQNLADYGDDAFAKMIFTNSFTKVFLQNGATKDFLKNTFDLSDTDISRALSVSSQKPIYSEFFALSANMSQIFRLYPTQKFYEMAQTENISIANNKGVQ